MVNFVPQTISVWQERQNISIPAGTNIPFWDYHYLFISIYVYVFIYGSINLLIFMFINKKFKVDIFYKPKY